MTNEDILGASKITYKYQITIPKEVRNRCGYEQGDLVVFVREDNRLYLKSNNSNN